MMSKNQTRAAKQLLDYIYISKIKIFVAVNSDKTKSYRELNVLNTTNNGSLFNLDNSNTTCPGKPFQLPEPLVLEGNNVDFSNDKESYISHLSNLTTADKSCNVTSFNKVSLVRPHRTGSCGGRILLQQHPVIKL